MTLGTLEATKVEVVVGRTTLVYGNTPMVEAAARVETEAREAKDIFVELGNFY